MTLFRGIIGLVGVAILVMLILFFAFVRFNFLDYQPNTRQVEGSITAIQDLYTLEHTPPSGYYESIRQLTINNKTYYVPLAGEHAQSDARQLKVQQHVVLTVDANQTVQELRISP